MLTKMAIKIYRFFVPKGGWKANFNAGISSGIEKGKEIREKRNGTKRKG